MCHRLIGAVTANYYTARNLFRNNNRVPRSFLFQNPPPRAITPRMPQARSGSWLAASVVRHWWACGMHPYACMHTSYPVSPACGPDTKRLRILRRPQAGQVLSTCAKPCPPDARVLHISKGKLHTTAHCTLPDARYCKASMNAAFSLANEPRSQGNHLQQQSNIARRST